MKENYYETKGYRLRWARKAIGLTQLQLAKEVNTTQQTIHDYERNNRGSYADTRLLVNISNRCGVTVDWILTGKKLASGINVPVLPSPRDFVSWLTQNETDFYEQGHKIGFYLQDDSMVSQDNHSDSFKPQDVIIVSPNKCPAPNNYVIAVTSSKNSPILFRQLILKKNNHLLKPLNGQYATIILKPSIKIVAVVIEQRKRFCNQ